MHKYTAFICLLAFAAAARAEKFDFVVDDEVYFSLEVKITGQPAELADIGPLSFTDLGNSLFGYGSVYPGEFDVITTDNFPYFRISDDGGLGGSNADNVGSIAFQDNNPPPSSTGVAGGISFLIFDSGPDRVGFGFLDSGVPGGIHNRTFVGDFRLVPEPNTSSFVLMFGIWVGGHLVRQRIRANPK